MSRVTEYNKRRTLKRHIKKRGNTQHEFSTKAPVGKPIKETLQSLKEKGIVPIVLSNMEKLFVRATHFVLQDILPIGGSIAIAGPAGSGKSLMAYHLACLICVGENFLGIRVKKPLNVLFLSNEQDEHRLLRRLDEAAKKIGLKKQQKERIHAISTYGRPISRTRGCIQELGEDLVAYCMSHDIKVIFIDSLSGWIGDESNNSGSTTFVVDALRRIGSYGIATVCLNHSPKGSSTPIRGHNSQEDHHDAILWLKHIEQKSSSSQITLNFHKVREAPKHRFPDIHILLSSDEAGKPQFQKADKPTKLDSAPKARD